MCALVRGVRLVFVSLTVVLARTHIAEVEIRIFLAAISKFALLHCFSLGTVSLISRLESGTVATVSRSFRFIAYFSCTVAPPQSQQLAWEFPQYGCLHQSDTRRHVPRRPVRVALYFAPLGILLIDDGFHAHRHGCQRHLDEIPGVIDRFG